MIRTYELNDGGYVVSQGGAWAPGVFESAKAAELAVRSLSDEQIVERLGAIYGADGEDRPVTLAEVRQAAGL